MSEVVRFAKYYALDGLNTTEYTKTEVTHEKLFTRIKVKVTGPSTTLAAKEYVKGKERQFMDKLRENKPP